MGLDIYLQTTAQHSLEEAHEEAWSALFERKSNGEITEEQYDEERKALGPWPSRDRDTKGTYLRSSYNASGFNSAVVDLTGEQHDYYWVFEPLGRDWENGDQRPLTDADIPALEQCAARAEQVMGEIARSDALRVMFEAPVVPTDGVSEQIALRDARSEIKRYDQQMATFRAGTGHEPFAAYSNRSGAFFMDKPLEIVAAIPGRQFGRDGMFLVHRMDRAALDDYVAAAREAREMAERAIEWIKRDGSVHMSWSG